MILGREFIITGMRQVAAAQGIVIAAGTNRKDQDHNADDSNTSAAARQLAVQHAELQSADEYDIPLDSPRDDSGIRN